MRLLQAVALAVSLSTPAQSQYTVTKYFEPTSGITFSSINLPSGLTYRIALPQTTTSSDAIVQIVAPNTFGWCGLAWGGKMVNNPLSVAWPTKQTSGQAAVFSSRMANQYELPSPYSGATLTPLSISPSKTNGTHWTATARCQGCTQWSGNNLNTKSSTLFAYACSNTAVASPTSNTSSFQVHDTPGSWTHDLTLARNASFAKWVT